MGTNKHRRHRYTIIDLPKHQMICYETHLTIPIFSKTGDIPGAYIMSSRMPALEYIFDTRNCLILFN